MLGKKKAAKKKRHTEAEYGKLESKYFQNVNF